MCIGLVCIWYFDHTVFIAQCVDSGLMIDLITATVFDHIMIFKELFLLFHKLIISGKTVCSMIYLSFVGRQKPVVLKNPLYIIITSFSLKVRIELRHILQGVSQTPKINLVYP